MTYRYTVVSTLIAALLLGACGKKEDADPAAQEATASEAAASEAVASQPNEKKQDYWPVFAPLLAGTYGGECQHIPAAQSGDGAAITLATDGKASAPGFAADMHQAKKIMLSRELRNGQVYAFAMLATADNDGTILSLHNDPTADGKRASIVKGDKTFMCNKVVALDKVSSQPLYVAVGKALETQAQALSCLDIDNMGKSYAAEFKMANGVATLGKDSFDMSKAELETLSADEGASQLAYAVKLPGGQFLHVFYDDVTGKVKSVQGRNSLKPTHACDVKV